MHSNETRQGRSIGRGPLGFAAALLFCVLASAAGAEELPFYKGKTITFVVGYGAGGGYDLYARAIADHIANYIPGHPTVIVQNMAGAGSMQAANYVYNVAPKDGTVIAAAAQDIPSSQLLGTKGALYDSAAFNWLGAVVASNSIIYTWHAAGIKSWEDAKSKPVYLATSDVSTMAVPRAMNAMLGTRFQVVPGYAGTGEIKLALERGEMMGSGGTTWAGLAISSQDLIAGHLIDLLIQTGPRKEPDLPDVPLFSDIVQTEETKKIAEIMSLPNSIGYAYWVAPGVLADRIVTLRQAYVKTMRDPDFLAQAAKEKLLVRPQTAEGIAARVRQAFATPQAILNRTVEILSN